MPYSGRAVSSVGNDDGLKIDADTKTFTANYEKRQLMLETNASIYGIATASRYSLIVVACIPSLRVELFMVMSCSLESMVMVSSTSEHQSAPGFFKCSSSAVMLPRMMGNLLKSVAFRCMKQLSLAGRSRTTDNK